jgi:hypothetical protein
MRTCVCVHRIFERTTSWEERKHSGHNVEGRRSFCTFTLSSERQTLDFKPKPSKPS